MSPIPESEPGSGPEPALDPRLRTAILLVGLTGLGFTVAAAFFFGIRVAWSVGIGAALAALNLWALARVISTQGDEAPSRRRGVLAVVKMLGLVAVVWLLMRHGVASPIPMVVGLGSLPIGIVIGSLVSDRSVPERAKRD
jgi:hypothetical protein